MLRVKDIMTTDVITLSPEATLADAMELFAHRHVSGAPVVASGRLVGVVSTTDLMMLAASLSGVPTEREAPEIDACDVFAELEADESDNVPSPHYFNDLWDDAGADVTSRFAAEDSPEWNVLREHDVSEAMTRLPLMTLPPTASAEWAADVMRRHKIHRILITEQEQLLGIVSALDIVAAVADHRFSVRQYVFNDDKVFVDG